MASRRIASKAILGVADRPPARWATMARFGASCGVAIALAGASGAVGQVFPETNVRYVPVLKTRPAFVLPTAKHALVATQVEGIITAETGAPAELSVLYGYQEQDGSYSFCGVFEVSGRTSFFVMNSGGPGHEGEFHRDASRGLMKAYGCLGPQGLALR